MISGSVYIYNLKSKNGKLNTSSIKSVGLSVYDEQGSDIYGDYVYSLVRADISAGARGSNCFYYVNKISISQRRRVKQTKFFLSGEAEGLHVYNGKVYVGERSDSQERGYQIYQVVGAE